MQRTALALSFASALLAASSLALAQSPQAQQPVMPQAQPGAPPQYQTQPGAVLPYPGQPAAAPMPYPAQPGMPYPPNTAPIATVPPQPVASPPAAIPTRAGCFLGDHSGIAQPDATTVHLLVCDELHRAVPDITGIYVVTLQRLGRAAIVSLALQDATGRIIDRTSLQLNALEEVPMAAPRIVDSLVNHRPIAQTQQVGSVVSAESAKLNEKAGKTRFGLGIAATAFPGTNGIVAPGLDFAVYHETVDFAIGGDFRFGYRDNDSTKGSFAALSVGGRYFLTRDDIAPYLGTGLSWSGMGAKNSSFDGSGSGISAFAEFGVEALRTSRTRLTLGVRLNVPFYNATMDSRWDATTQTNSKDSKYIMPTTFAATVFF